MPQTCILWRLRGVTFFSPADAKGRGARINDHLMRPLGVTRRKLFETLDRPALAPLPDDYVFVEWRLGRVNLAIMSSAIASATRSQMPVSAIRFDVRATWRTIKVFHKGVRVAPLRRFGSPRHGTDPANMRVPIGITPSGLPTLPALCSDHRSAYEGARYRHPGPPASSRAGRADLPGCSEAVPRIAGRAGLRRAPER